MNIPLKENERLDDLQNGYHIIQNTRDFCYGIDAVLLSDFARVKKGEQAIQSHFRTDCREPYTVSTFSVSG